MKTFHISFDFDYTLADSSQGTIICANYALEKIGLKKCTEQEIKKTIGLSLKESYRQLVDNFDQKEFETFCEYFLLKADEVVTDHIKFYPHTKVVLQTLKQQGHYISIVSTKFSKRILSALQRDQIDHLIDTVIGGDMVKQNKPNPEGLELAISQSKINKLNTFYVGDSKSDAIAAKNSAVKFIGTLTGMTEKKVLNQYQPIAIINDLSELPNIVNDI